MKLHEWQQMNKEEIPQDKIKSLKVTDFPEHLRSWVSLVGVRSMCCNLAVPSDHCVCDATNCPVHGKQCHGNHD